MGIETKGPEQARLATFVRDLQGFAKTAAAYRSQAEQLPLERLSAQQRGDIRAVLDGLAGFYAVLDVRLRALGGGKEGPA